MPPSKRVKTSARYLQSAAPLAEKLRPQSLADFVGQSHIVGAGSLLMSSLENGAPLGSMIFWGPPGCGKTTLARLLAKRADAVFKELSATIVGINEVRAIFEEAKGTLAVTGRKTILFLDEVHRFNKGQQDIFLPFLEQGHIQLIGATTENPSFKLTSALLSRCRVFVLEKLTDEDVKQILINAIHRVQESSTPSAVDVDAETTNSESEPSSSQTTLAGSAGSAASEGDVIPFPAYPQLTSKILSSIVSLSTGDARTALSLLELVLSSKKDITEASLLSSLQRSVAVSYDRTGESHYDMISALHKCLRGSQGSAAMYWLARMLNGGEDPLYIARRLCVVASEEVGLADNHALPLAMATFNACEKIGMPECRINLAHLVAYLAEAPKSTRAYEAYNRAEAAAKLDPTIPVPLQMRNAPTGLMKDLGYGKDYAYNPHYAHPVHNEYVPIQFEGDVFLRKEGDLTDKIWDDDALTKWEIEENGGKEWEGRNDRGPGRGRV
ncbi:hypothetical protein PLICRDRAFT_103807 [Plicaturopsis crispa FD-325 SS-3]|nr:hypothetical protein PLICRDRAFT_103807 [Plicaturopsis crispa FD-325 SS-3]